MSPTKKKTIAIIGGGASGIFASIRCAEVAKEKKIEANICVFEATTIFLCHSRYYWHAKMVLNQLHQKFKKLIIICNKFVKFKTPNKDY